LVGLTAWQALFDAMELAPDQTVLIHAAAGGVGHIAVQLARWKGARVIGTASARNEAYLRDLGVDEFVDYRVTRFEDVIQDVDAVLDPIGGETRERSWDVLRENGILVGLGGKVSVPANAAARGVRGTYLLAHPDGAQLAEIARLVDAGRVRPTVEAVFPLAQAREAHLYWDTEHTRGKIVLRVAEE
jgi:NADPH:quinone reductase-like Zn-dependent oxidoreductase